MQIVLTIIFFLISQTTINATCLPETAKFDVGFSPNHGSLEVILKGINIAKKQILIASYSFTSKPIAIELVKAKKRGIKILIIVDKNVNSSQNKYSVVKFLTNQGISVRFNGHYKIHHHKFMIIDGKHVEIGSFNYSNSANNKNAENVLLIQNVKSVANIYSIEWKKLWDESHKF